MSEHDGYDGPLQVLGEKESEGVPAEAMLRGRFEPIDGRFHWYGRLASSPALAAAHRAGDDVRLRTPHGEAPARLSDVDPWGRFRVTGTGRPPFPV